ncbi:hypothetical protein BC940DRAFT_310659 [Gongronella butleri]|nr:hypothetical protein BC940DRAFT_310659 [Gongronella butleri]
MPRYRCDVCHCSFPDNPANRKKHISGVVHQQNKKYHYDWFRDPQEVINEHLQKPPCRRFQQTRSCDFGLMCRYSHILRGPRGEPVYPPELVDWLQARSEAASDDKQVISGTSHKPKQDGARTKTMLPPGWHVHDLPPSLHPPPPSTARGYDWDHVGVWG